MVDIIKPGQPRVTYHSLTPEKAAELVEDCLANDRCARLALGVWGESREGMLAISETAMLQPQARLALRNAGLIDPENIRHYIARGGYTGLERALGMSGEDVIAENRKRRTQGPRRRRFPHRRQVAAVQERPRRPKYLICNADEGDPGLYEPRPSGERPPRRVEGMLIGAYAIGASHGYIYVRAEYRWLSDAWASP